MSDYRPAPGPGDHPRAESAFAGLSARLGERLGRRPEPRFTVALAGVGAALILFGIVLWGGTYFGQGFADQSFGGSSDRKLLGAGLAAVVTVLGYVALISVRRGALATAGVVAAGVGVPLTIAFLTLDFGQFGGGTPINSDAVFWVSVIVWVASYLFVPGARGHTFYVFLVAYGFYLYVLSKNIGSVEFDLFSRGGSPFHGLGTIAALSLVIGLGYYVLAFALDRTGRFGPATGLVYPAFNATAVGILAWAPDLHLLGSGIVTVLIGLTVCLYGGTFGRRLTCFAAAVAVAVGIGLLIRKAAPHDGNAAGIGFILVGIAVVAAAVLVATALAERDDMDPEVVVTSR